MNTMMLVSLVVAMAMTVSANPSYRLAELEEGHLENEADSGVEKRSVSLSQYRTNQLNIHNAKRAIHSAYPLSLDATLNSEAQAYAEYLLSIQNPSQHCSYIKSQNIPGIGCDSSTTNAGENLAWTSAQNDNFDGSTLWYDEVDLYDFCDHGFSSGTGHFTAMVWKPTTLVGFGRAIGASGTYEVARYVSPGNVGGQYHINVGDAPASLNRPACPATDPPSSSRVAECERIAGLTGTPYYYNNYTPKPSVFGLPPCYLICQKPSKKRSSGSSPQNVVFGYNWITGQLDCEKPDGSTGICVSNVCT
ncbi:unnamed protein product [Owenia fusiformis]|uniref:SCP domain-containing protein n=1 Tax=Owenia fusiformis TaxID=6347 RepID=A0A8S4Q8M9_OWEFU|nr:unnamed protein product [Owenia fusiformis]